MPILVKYKRYWLKVRGLIKYYIAAGILSVTIFTSCEELDAPINYSPNLSLYERYKNALVDINLDSTLLGKKWILTGTESLRDTLLHQIPLREAGYFNADDPRAVTFRIEPEIGELLTFNLEVLAVNGSKFFMDLFEEINADFPRYLRVSSIDSVLNIQYEVRNKRPHILRIQPELLVSGKYVITITSKPSLSFPVSGKNSNAIGSAWGDPRDGGRRSHRGVDIFAPRGTEALAAFDGVVSHVGLNKLGGKVVWLRNNKRKLTLYYAHLDSQIVHRGQKVLAGEPVGLIGNTGNALYTPPHLHFGVYWHGRGGVNPIGHLKESNKNVPEIGEGDDFLNNWLRVKNRNTLLKRSPSLRSEVLSKLDPGYPVMITGVTKGWYRIRLPNDNNGYVRVNDLEIMDDPLQALFLNKGSYLTANPKNEIIPIDSISEGKELKIMGTFNHFYLVESLNGKYGWIKIPNYLGSTSALVGVSAAE